MLNRPFKSRGVKLILVCGLDPDCRGSFHKASRNRSGATLRLDVDPRPGGSTELCSGGSADPGANGGMGLETGISVEPRAHGSVGLWLGSSAEQRACSPSGRAELKGHGHRGPGTPNTVASHAPTFW